ncbi:MAG: acyltransferase [Beijerinckiaceae bacterium]|nr:acyltransferase [Beijerinckiaceae bacterium]
MSEVAGKSGLDLAIGANADAATAAAPALAGQRNIRLQYLRAAAAIAVVLYHGAHYLDDLRGDGRFLPIFSGFFGGYGVAVFFALSGYLMAELIVRDTPGRFLMSRLARIYPPMLLLTGLFALAFILAGQPRGLNALSLSLVPAGPRGYFLAVEWTLLYEMSYYVVLACLGFLGFARYATPFVFGWLGLVVFAWVWGPGRADIVLPVLSELPLSMINLPFLLGFLCAGAHRRGWLPPGLAIAAALAALPMAVLSYEYLRLFAGLSASLLVAAAIRSPSQPALHWPGRLGARFGDASYVLYLCHVPVFLLVEMALPERLPSALVWVAMVGSALGLALLLGPADLGLHRWLKRAIDRAPARRVRASALGFIAAFLTIGIYAEWEVRTDRAEEAQARRILTAPLAVPSPGMRAEIDSVSRLGNTRWVVRGYGVDLEQPRLATHIAIRQGGDLVAIDRMRRMRVATARELGRKDLESQRFGFAIMLPADFDCAKGPPEAVFIFEDGRATPLPPGALATVCP